MLVPSPNPSTHVAGDRKPARGQLWLHSEVLILKSGQKLNIKNAGAHNTGGYIPEIYFISQVQVTKLKGKSISVVMCTLSVPTGDLC